MKKINIIPLTILSIFILIIFYFVWFAYGMSPGGNFSKNEEVQIIKPTNSIVKDPFLDSTINQYVIALNKMDVNSLQSITTENGFKSLLEWSDSLKDTAFFVAISNILSQRKICNLVDYDTTITLSLGEPNEILGATGGYLFLKKVNNQLKINQFRGGK